MIGILGGTFDPVHCGHLRLALELYQTLPFDEMRLMPCGLPPHRAPSWASGEQRFEMLRLAIDGEPGLVVDERELRREGPSYMCETLASLRDEFGEHPLCLILGWDAFVDLPTWARWREIPALAHLIVVHRPGVSPEVRAELSGLMRECRVEDVAVLQSQPAGCLLLQSVTQLEISATQIRALIVQQKSARYLLPDAVWRYIQQQNLYQ